MSDERQQSTSVLVIILIACLWLSHEAAVRFPSLPGTVDLRPWVKFWNRSIIINWPVASILFALTAFLGWRLRHAGRRTTGIKKPIRNRDEEYPPIE